MKTIPVELSKQDLQQLYHAMQYVISDFLKSKQNILSSKLHTELDFEEKLADLRRLQSYVLRKSEGE